MKRLQKKCFVFSAGFHALLALILVVGPGFFASKNIPEDVPTLDMIPDKVIDSAFRMGGANNQANHAPPPPPAPPQVEQQARPAPKLPELEINRL